MPVSSSCVILAALPVFAQAPNDPFPAPIAATEGVIKVNFVEFASLPDLGGQQPSRPMLLVDEPGTRRMFVNDMRGPLYTVSRDGKSGDAVPRHQRPELGRERQLVRATSADSRASRSIRSSTAPARRDTASSTPTLTPANMTLRRDFKPADPKGTHARISGTARVDGKESCGSRL